MDNKHTKKLLNITNHQGNVNSKHRAAAAPSLEPASGSLDESQVNSFLPCQTERTEWHQNGPGCLKLLGGIKTKWEMHRCGVFPLGLWTAAESLPEK